MTRTLRILFACALLLAVLLVAAAAGVAWRIGYAEAIGRLPGGPALEWGLVGLVGLTLPLLAASLLWIDRGVVRPIRTLAAVADQAGLGPRDLDAPHDDVARIEAALSTRLRPPSWVTTPPTWLAEAEAAVARINGLAESAERAAGRTRRGWRTLRRAERRRLRAWAETVVAARGELAAGIADVRRVSAELGEAGLAQADSWRETAASLAGEHRAGTAALREAVAELGSAAADLRSAAEGRATAAQATRLSAEAALTQGLAALSAAQAELSVTQARIAEDGARAAKTLGDAADGLRNAARGTAEAVHRAVEGGWRAGSARLEALAAQTGDALALAQAALAQQGRSTAELGAALVRLEAWLERQAAAPDSAAAATQAARAAAEDLVGRLTAHLDRLTARGRDTEALLREAVTLLELLARRAPEPGAWLELRVGLVTLADRLAQGVGRAADLAPTLDRLVLLGDQLTEAGASLRVTAGRLESARGSGEPLTDARLAAIDQRLAALVAQVGAVRDRVMESCPAPSGDPLDRLERHADGVAVLVEDLLEAAFAGGASAPSERLTALVEGLGATSTRLGNAATALALIADGETQPRR